MKAFAVSRGSLISWSLLFLVNLYLSREADGASCTGRVRSVIIVGAGMAGVSAAYNITLSNPCFKVTVLEARDRVGGRMFTRKGTLPGTGTPIQADMGAQWIQSYVGNPITALAKKYKQPIRFMNGEDAQYTASGKQYSSNAYDAAEAKYQAFLVKVAAYAENLDNDISFEQALRSVDASYLLNPYVQSRLAEDFEFEFGGLKKLSAWYYGDKAFGGGDAIAYTGYDSLPRLLLKDALTAGANLLLQHVVKKITVAHSGSVQVSAVDSKGALKYFSADAVIVTLPLGVLKANKVAFQPPLSSRKLGAIKRLGFGTVNKIFFFYKKAFWDTAVNEYTIEDSVLPANRGRFVDWINIQIPWRQTALEGVSVGDYAERMATMDDKTVIADASAKVAAMFPSAKLPANKPSVVWIQRWNTDPYALGSYSYAAVGDLGNSDQSDTVDFDILAEPEQGRLFFAGEHTHTTFRSTVHGAYLSGVREAQRVLKSI